MTPIGIIDMGRPTPNVPEPGPPPDGGGDGGGDVQMEEVGEQFGPSQQAMDRIINGPAVDMGAAMVTMSEQLDQDVIDLGGGGGGIPVGP